MTPAELKLIAKRSLHLEKAIRTALAVAPGSPAFFSLREFDSYLGMAEELNQNLRKAIQKALSGAPVSERQ